MSHDHDNHEDGISRRHTLECMLWAGTGVQLGVGATSVNRIWAAGLAASALVSVAIMSGLCGVRI